MHTKPTQLCSISNPNVSSVDSSPPPSLISSQEQPAPLKDHIGSITVADDHDSLEDHQLAPELLQKALEQYNDLDAYLDTLKADATKKRKNKKKQKT
ncbi:hypothetical protein VP01_8865g1 [Puccinia sorghi]|uniref:Uncharacterized protein n=1 Tax=Puccinia sorghi TaxID=27349 RepID=A0A0L6U8B6_9BASI|nr:hypothetical protein VP01_8865g1 [Puccinia sorghi]